MNRDEFERIATGDPLKYLADNFAPRVVGLEKAKKALILTMASGDDANDRRRIHTILFGPPGTAKTLLLRAVAKEANTIVLGPRASKGGLTVDFRSGNVGIIGQIHDTPSQVLAIDEMEKLENDVLDQLLTAMESGEIRYAGGGATDVIPAHVRMVAAVNNMDKLSRELVDRFDYAIHVPSPTRIQAQQVVKGIAESFMAKPGETNEQEPFVVRDYLEHARQNHPEFDKGERRLTQIIFRMMVATEREGNIRLRRFPGILRTAYALARLRNSDMTAYHVLEAINVQHPTWQPPQLTDFRRILDFREEQRRFRRPVVTAPEVKPIEKPDAQQIAAPEAPPPVVSPPPPQQIAAPEPPPAPVKRQMGLGDPEHPANRGTGLE